jgi:His/Glu/Gln/Arg/opine family amino acid ABC transporter permease subunit
VIDYLDPWWPTLLAGAWVTLKLVALVAVLSTAIAIGVAIALSSPQRRIVLPARTFVEVFRSIPALVLLMVLYFSFGRQVGSLGISAFWVAVIALTLNQAAYTADLYRSAIASVGRQQWEAATSIGLSRRQAYRLVILPQAAIPAIAPTANMLVMIVKDSALASLVTVNELILSANRVVQNTFEILPTYLVVAAFYLCVTVPLIYLARHVERRVTRLTTAHT